MAFERRRALAVEIATMAVLRMFVAEEKLAGFLIRAHERIGHQAEVADRLIEVSREMPSRPSPHQQQRAQTGLTVVPLTRTPAAEGGPA